MSEIHANSDAKQVRARIKNISPSTFIISLALIGSLGFVVGVRSKEIAATVSPIFGVKMSAQSIDLSSVEDTYRNLEANYDGDLDEQALIDGASRGLVEAAGDRYTVFMDRKESERFEKEMSGEVSGIGAQIGTRSGEPTIVRVLDDAPAKKAGLQANDTILAVNDESMKGASSEDAAKKIRGDAGTSVKLVVRRGVDTREFTIVRAKVNDKSVRSEVRDGIGLLTISRFDTDTAQLASAAAEEFKRQGVRGVVLDLRDNGGGYLDSSCDVSAIWLDNKVVAVEKSMSNTVEGIRPSEKCANEGSTDKMSNKIKTTSAGAVLAGVKTIVLVNGSSASASEIVAGALQEHGAASLVGEKTFGKGTVQKLIPLSGGRQLKVTVAKWYTPKGVNITKEGIAPDTKVQLTSEDADAGRDPQLDAAFGLIKQ